MYTNKIILFALLLTASFPATAQVAGWKLRPNNYSSMEPFTPNLLKVQRGGLFGLVDADGEVIAECKDSNITFSEGHCLLIESDNRLISRLGPDGSSIGRIQDELYVDPDNPYYSNGLLAVRYKQKWGYLDLNGKAAIDPKLDRAYPFFHGMGGGIYKKMAVHFDESCHFLRGDENTFVSSYTLIDGHILALVMDTRGRVFLRDRSGNVVEDLGKVQNWDNASRTISTDKRFKIEFAPNRQVKVIAQDGRPYKNCKLTERDSFVFPEVGIHSQENNAGMYNLMMNGREVLASQFQERPQAISSTRLIAKRSGAYGIIEADYNAVADVKLPAEIVFEHHMARLIEIPFTISNDFKPADYHARILVEDRPVYDGAPVKNVISFNYLPQELADDMTVSFRIQASLTGLSFPETAKEIRVRFIPAVSISIASSVSCNDQPYGKVSVSVRNDSSTASDACTIYFNGEIVQKDVHFEPNQTKHFSFNQAVKMQDLDRISKQITVEIREKGCSVSSSATRTVVFERF